MRIIVVGAGEVGLAIARQLADEGKDIVLIDNNPDVVKNISSSLDVAVLVGDATDEKFLKKAGIEETSMFIAVTSDDEVNLIACFLVSSIYDVPIKIARIHNIHYSESSAFATGFAGVDCFVNPDYEAAVEVLHTVEQGADRSITIFDGTDVQIREYDVGERDYVASKTIKEVRTGIAENFIIAGVVRGGELIIPDGDFKVEAGDHVYVVSIRKTFRRLSKIFGVKQDSLRKLLVVGGSNIGVMLAEMLMSRGRSVTFIDKDYDRCKFLSERLPDALILNGNVSDTQIQADEQIADADAVISCTSNEELNILSGIYMKHLGVKRAVALVENSSYVTIAGNIGINSVVSPKVCAVNSILKYIRRGGVNTVRSIFEGRAEAIQVKIAENAPIVGKAVKDIHFPRGCLVVAITRANASTIPDGNSILMGNDKAVFFVLRDSIAALEEMLV
ncbi:Trk system potassium transporter TrkA [Deferribacterales bacterium RsTz2092]|nr:Trk system potassium transport protein TrkA [Deferribacterales bacterium]